VRYVQPLTEEQRALLEKTMQDDASFRARTRAHSRLLSSPGTTLKDLAKTSQVDRDPVSSWLQHWAPHGAQRVPDPPRSGRPPTLTPDEQVIAPHSIKEAPRSLHSVVERFANHTETRRSLASLKRLAQKARRQWKRVRKSGTRLREPAAWAQGHRALEAWQHQEDHGKSALSSLDEAGFALEPSLPSAWQEPASVSARPAMRYGRSNG
jgi:transposase